MATINNDFKVKNGLVVGTTATILSTTQSVGTNTGALIVPGGAGIGKDLYVGGTVVARGYDLMAYDGSVHYVSDGIGNDSYDGRRHVSAFKSIKHALGQAQSGDTVLIETGTYYEQFPLTVPQGVSVRGAGLRAVTVYPTTATNTQTAFLLNGESYISDFTVTGFYKPGNAFAFAPGAKITTRSPYVERFSVITRGTNPTANDPYGFDSADAGNGAYLDASILDPTSLEPAMLWNEATFIVPNATGFYMTNGARAELLNGFVYFADKAILAEAGTAGYGGVGKTRLKLSNVTGNFATGDTIIYKSSTGTVLASGIISSTSSGYIFLEGPVWGFQTALDASTSTQIVYSTGVSPSTATSIVLADYHQFGAELRCIGSAAVFGNQGVIANGTGTDLKLIAFNLSAIGSGKDLSDDFSLTVQSNEIIQLNGGKIYYQTVDQYGDFRVGDRFLVNQRTGDVSFNSATINLSNLSSLVISDGINSTTLTPGNIVVGSLNFAGNTISSQSGNITIDPAGTLTTINSDTSINGKLTVGSTTQAVSTDTGALTVAGGLGIGGNLWVGGTMFGAFNGSLTGVATTATNLFGGAEGQLLYQSGFSQTSFVGPGTAGDLLVSHGTTGPRYQNTLTLSSSSYSTTTISGNALQVEGGVGAGYIYVTNKGWISGAEIVTTATIGNAFAGAPVTNPFEITNTASNALTVAGGAVIGGNVIINGTVQFNGTSTVINSNSVDIGNKLIYLSTLSNSAVEAIGSGFIIGQDPLSSTSTNTWASLTFDGGTPGNWIVGNGLMPTLDDKFNIGDPLKRWSILYANTVTSARINGTEVRDNSNRVVTSVTPTSGTGIGISGITTTGPATGFNIENLGVTSASGSAYIGVSATTGSIIIENLGVHSLTGSTYLGVSTATGTVTLTNLGVTSLTSGTDISLSATIGNITINNTSTLQSVAARGAISNNAITIADTSPSTNTTSGALTVAGGVGIQGSVYAGNVYSNGNPVLTSASGGYVVTISAGTDTAVTTSTGNVIVYNTSTLQSITNRGATTNNAISITNTNISTSTTTGALIVTGGTGVGGDLYVGGAFNATQPSYVGGAQILTTATVNQFASQTAIFAGTDTAVNTSTGNVTVWNTSTLQTVTSRGATTNNQIRIDNVLSSTSSYASNALYVAGGIGGNSGFNINGNGYLNGDLVVFGTITGTNVTLTTLSASSGTFYGDASGAGALYAGAIGFTPFPQTMFQATGNSNTYMEINVQNVNAGNKASTDIVASADNVTENNAFIDMGITSSGWDGTQLNSFADNLGPNDGYLLVGDNELPAAGHLVIGTLSSNTSVKIVVAGTNSNYLTAVFNTRNTESLSTVSGALVVYGGIGTGGAINATHKSYVAGAEILTTATVNQFASQTSIFAGTDTRVTTSTGIITIWNESTLQTVTSRGATTNAAVSITNDTQSTGTTTGALVVSGGAAIAKDLWVGGSLNVNGSQVITTATLGASGVTSITAGTGIFVNASTGNVIITNIGVQTLTAGTDTRVNSSTGTVIVWNESTLQTITSRGATSNNTVSITNTTAANATNSGALQVVGGVGIGGDLYVGGEIIAQKLTIQLTTVTTTQVTTDDIISTYNTTNAISTNSGALQVAGGAGVGRDLYVGGSIYSNGILVGYGYAGSVGYTGSQGDIGYTGSRGVGGYSGSVGFTGSIGYAGSAGYTGSQGAAGYNGSVGYTGSAGLIGYAGSAGYNGSVGFTGSQGSAGYSGSRGFDGSQGSAGYNGSVGYTGSQGSAGYNGSVGFTGSQGSAGYNGSVGYTGSRGDIGYAGSAGYNGSVGFTGSKGFAGSAGYDGSKGFTGSAGYNGSVGYTGSQGSAGYNGSVGYTGSQGTAGYNGSVGYTGSKGDIGYAGSAGPSNIINATAATTGIMYPVMVPATGSNQTAYADPGLYYDTNANALYISGEIIASKLTIELTTVTTTLVTTDDIIRTTNTTASTSTSSGALQISGGAGIGGNINVGGNVGIKNTTLSSQTDSVATWAYNSTLSGISNPTEIFFKSDGLRMYVATAAAITQYTLSVAWDITTAVVGTSYSMSLIDTATNGLFISPDGTKMITCGQTGVVVANGSDVAGQDRAYYFTLSTPWDVTTATLVSSIRFALGDAGGIPAAMTAPQAVDFNNDGTIMYVQDSTTDYVNQFALSSAYNVGTATWTKRFNIVGEESGGTGLRFNSTGTRMYVYGSTGDDVNEYRLGTPWDIATAVYYDRFYTGWYEATPTGMYINESANVAFLCGSTSDVVLKFLTDKQGLQLNPETITGKIDLVGNTRVENNFYVDGSAGFEGPVTTFNSLSVGTDITVGGNDLLVGSATAAASLFSGITTGALSIATSETTGAITVGGIAATGIITIGQSTVNQTLNLSAGATTAVSTKIINIGTAGLAGSTSTINIGSTIAGALGVTTIGGTQTIIVSTTNATSTNTGALQVAGGLGIGGDLYVGGIINGSVAVANSATTVAVTNEIASASSHYLTFVTTSTGWTGIKTGATTGIVYQPSRSALALGSAAPVDSDSWAGAIMDVKGPIYARQSNGTSYISLATYLNTSYISAQGATNKMVFQTASSEKMRITTTGEVGIGTSAPGKKLTISRATETTSEQLELRTVGGITTGNYDGIVWTQGAAGATVLSSIRLNYNTTGEPDMAFNLRNESNVLFLKNGGNVGIGTNNPSAKLQISSGATSAELMRLSIGYDTSRNDRGGIHWHDTTNSTGRIFTEYDGTMVSMGFGSLYNSGYNSNTLMTIRGNGNVGIGTNSPASILEVKAAVPIVTISPSGYTNQYQTTLGALSGAQGFLIFGNNAQNEIRAGRTTAGGYLDFYTNNTVAQGTASDGNFVMRLAANGNLGIGTTTVSAKLHVVGTESRFGGVASGYISVYDNSGRVGYIQANGGTDLRIAAEGATTPMTFYVNGSERARLDINGNFGIGTTGPTAKLQVELVGTVSLAAATIVKSTDFANTARAGFPGLTNNSDGIYFGMGANGTGIPAGFGFFREATGWNTALAFYTNNVTSGPNSTAAMQEKMRINSAGNVGIGTSTPYYKLEVNGSFAATTKSFVIDHPTKPGMKLRYGSLEGPENGVYVRGKLTGSNKIELPDYWTKLVDPDSITVSLTSIGNHQDLYVADISNNVITIGNGNILSKAINCFYVVYGERCDVEKLEVEITHGR